MHGYTATANPDTSAKALGKELPISPKLAREVCGMIRGMKVDKAIQALEDVIALKRPVPLKRYSRILMALKFRSLGHPRVVNLNLVVAWIICSRDPMASMLQLNGNLPMVVVLT